MFNNPSTERSEDSSFESSHNYHIPISDGAGGKLLDVTFSEEMQTGARSCTCVMFHKLKAPLKKGVYLLCSSPSLQAEEITWDATAAQISANCSNYPEQWRHNWIN